MRGRSGDGRVSRAKDLGTDQIKELPPLDRRNLGSKREPISAMI